MKTKLVSGVFALILLTIVVSTYSVLFKLNTAQINSQKIAQNLSTAQNPFDFAGAKAGNIPVVPVPGVQINSSSGPAPTTPVETMFLAGGFNLYFPSFGGVFSSTDVSSWNQVIANAPWGVREGHTLTSFSNIMFLIGGTDSTAARNDVWISNDGNNWLQWLVNAPWGARTGHETLVHNGQLFILGGGVTGTLFSDVWSSLDGQTWLFLTGASPWTPRIDFSSVSFNGKIYVIGGSTAVPVYPYYTSVRASDVWSSPDGVTWNQEIANAPWGSRSKHSSVVLNGKIYIIGGIETGRGLTNDVWSSSDGINWTQETASAPWSVREGHISLVFDGYMWVIGGTSNYCQSSVCNDFWKSRDGINWVQQTNNNPNPYVMDFAGVVMP